MKGKIGKNWIMRITKITSIGEGYHFLPIFNLKENTMATRKKTNSTTEVTETAVEIAAVDTTTETIVQTPAESAPKPSGAILDQNPVNGTKANLEANTGRITRSEKVEKPAEQTEQHEQSEQPTDNLSGTLTLNTLMNIRAKPDLNATIITTKPEGSRLPVIRVYGKWVKVAFGGRDAFVLYDNGKYGKIGPR